ncbi:MAG: calcineurin-like phosphoesterase C-terminal domain-containing protein [Gemmatimonadaceae bacterium]
MHESEHLTHGRVHEHVAGAACGVWWSGPICTDGTPNGYAVYEIDGEDVRWRYKGTGLAATEQIRAYAQDCPRWRRRREGVPGHSDS